MRPEAMGAERAKAVRDAARGWGRAGFIDEVVVARTGSLYPDDRRRFGPGFRALAFIFTSIAVWAMVGLSFVLFEPRGNNSGALLLFWTAVLAILTEVQRGPGRRADAGAESATALISVILGVAGVVIVVGDSSIHSFLIPFFASSWALCVIAAWRWGDGLFFLGAGLAGFGFLTQTDQGRLLWIMASVLLIPASLKAGREPKLSPSHRHGAVILGAVAVLALYGALHIWSWDQRAVEYMNSAAPSTSNTATLRPLRWLSILATALLPPGLLLAGWRRREPLLLYAGLLLVGASIATIRLYHQVMPLSLALILVGTVCLALAMGVRRWLRSGDKGERDGFTADPLFDHTNRTDAIRSVVAMASFTPAAQAPSSPPGFKGGGGSFGGGGATADF